MALLSLPMSSAISFAIFSTSLYEFSPLSVQLSLKREGSGMLMISVAPII